MRIPVHLALASLCLVLAIGCGADQFALSLDAGDVAYTQPEDGQQRLDCTAAREGEPPGVWAAGSLWDRSWWVIEFSTLGPGRVASEDVRVHVQVRIDAEANPFWIANDIYMDGDEADCEFEVYDLGRRGSADCRDVPGDRGGFGDDWWSTPTTFDFHIDFDCLAVEPFVDRPMH